MVKSAPLVPIEVESEANSATKSSAIARYSALVIRPSMAPMMSIPSRVSSWTLSVIS